MILIVEDHIEVLHLMVSVCVDAGYSATTAITGAEAVETFDRHFPVIRLVTIDILLPDMNGVDLAKAMRARSAALPIIGVTGGASNIAPADRQLFSMVLVKPFDRERLAALIKHFLPVPA